MKKISALKMVSISLGGLLLTISAFQCTKNEGLVKDLDRSFKGSADSTVYASFYEKNIITPSDATDDVNDVIKYRSVQTVLHEYCGTSNCHGGPISPKFDSYADVMKYVSPGDPATSKLWEYITTNDFNKAMPPINSNHELNTLDKGLVYNWIKNGAKERPNLADFRPAAIRLINDGCGSANCHNQGTATGAWARAGLVPVTSADTTTFLYTDQISGAKTYYCLLTNTTLRNQYWTAYKDSVKKFYADTLANASFRPYKTFGTPTTLSSVRGPLQTYDDIIMDIMYPKSVRSVSSVVYTDPITLKKYYARGDNLFTAIPNPADSRGRNPASSMVSRIDSTIIMIGPRNNLSNLDHTGDMAYGDGGLKPNEVALIKAWYFADPNIPSVWKYGPTNAGIFKYRKTGNLIKP